MRILTRHTFKLILCTLLVFVLLSSFGNAATLVNINTADKAALMTLTGIGEVKAQAIIDYRETNGPFATIEGIMNVSGIGTATFNTIKDSITVGAVQTTENTTPQSETTTVSTTGNTVQTTNSTSAPVALVDHVSAGSNRIVSIGMETEFTGVAYDSKNRTIEEVSFSWNFGDGTTAVGKTVRHRFPYVGKYAVVLEAARYDSSATHRITVTAEEPDISLKVLSDGGVVIDNKSPRDLDISGWKIVDRGMSFAFPGGTIILKEASAHIAVAALHFNASPLAKLFYSDGTFATGVATSTGEVSTETVTEEPDENEAIVETFSTEESSPKIENFTDDTPPIGSESSKSEVAAVDTSVQSHSSLWWLMLFSILILIGFAVFAGGKLGNKDWTIVDEGGDTV